MKQKLSTKLERGNLLPTLLLMPAVAFVFCIIIIPMCYGLYVSFFSYKLGGELTAESFVGLKNYLRVFQDKTALRSIVNHDRFCSRLRCGRPAFRNHHFDPDLPALATDLACSAAVYYYAPSGRARGCELDVGVSV